MAVNATSMLRQRLNHYEYVQISRWLPLPTVLEGSFNRPSNPIAERGSRWATIHASLCERRERSRDSAVLGNETEVSEQE
jgi:hypothetical protein